jgi:hypothetical protein
MYHFIRSARIDRIGLLLAFCFLSGVPNFAHCQSSANYSIRTQVLDNGGGTCGSDHHRLTFSIGPAMGDGTSQDSTRNLSPGFIASMAGLREADDGSENGDETETDESGETDDGADTDGGSSSGGQCFIGILF